MHLFFYGLPIFVPKIFISNFIKMDKPDESSPVIAGRKEACAPETPVINSLQPGGPENSTPIRVLGPAYSGIKARLFSPERGLLKNLRRGKMISHYPKIGNEVAGKDADEEFGGLDKGRRRHGEK